MDVKLNHLLAKLEEEARREDFPVDTPIYTKCGKDPLVPILFTGSPNAPVCFFARDLGKDEVTAGQPLYGAAGRMVRGGVYKVLHGKESQNRSELEQVESVLFTNTVPYKPPGNKAYSSKIKERFRPFLLDFFINHFEGNIIISLGTEAFQWFTSFDRKAVEEFWKKDNRYEEELALTLKWEGQEKKILLQPLPHPSPLNQTWYGKFPGLLEQRLRKIF